MSQSVEVRPEVGDMWVTLAKHAAIPGTEIAHRVYSRIATFTTGIIRRISEPQLSLPLRDLWELPASRQDRVTDSRDVGKATE